MNQHRIDHAPRQTRNAMPWKALTLVVMPAMLMLTAATDTKTEKKGGIAVWIALAAVFIALGASMAARSNKSAKGKGADGSGGDTIMASDGGDGGHHAGHHHDGGSHDGDSGGDSGGGGDGGGGGD